MTIENKVLKNKYSNEGRPVITVHDTEHLTLRAQTCLDMICRWGMVSGNTDSEDSAGRARTRLQTVDEVVSRAVRTTNVMFKAFEDEGWIHTLPTLDEAKEIAKEEESNITKAVKNLTF